MKELTVEQLKILIQEAVEEKLQELVGDPDQGLELREEVRQRLAHSVALALVEKGTSIEQVAKELGLE